MSAPPVNAGDVRRLFDLVCDLLPEQRRATFATQHADAATIAEVEDLLRADGATRGRVRSPVIELLAGMPETELDEGDRLGAWRLLRRLAKGGMGAVYLAERADGHFEQEAAIKLIRGFPGEDTLLHFARERQILATLKHPHIAHLLDGGATPGGQPYLVMEYVEGEPVDVYCERHDLTLDARLVLFLQICGAVQFAHQRLIVHCDLKPSNVLVRADGTPVLLDFGIARALDRQRGREPIDSGYFTPSYASPEQLRGEPVTTASDVYALGLILFELVAGRKARLDTEDRTVTLLGDAAVQPSQLAGAVRWRGRLVGDIDAIVLRATAAAPSSRYAAADALAADIQRYRELRPVSARPSTPAYRIARLLRRRWPQFVAGALLALLVGVFTWRLATERDRARAAESEARVQAATAGRVSDFLVSVFNVSNPKINQQRDISARDVLDQGAARIDHELGDQPRVKAKLVDTLATAYRFIGEPQRSVELFRTAVDLYLDPRVGDPLSAARALSQLAIGYSNNSYPHAQAEAAARRSLDLRERNGADALDLADAYNTLGVVLESEDKFDEAQAMLQKALALRRANGADPSTLGSSLHNLALVASSRGDGKAALALYAEALELRRRGVGEHHPDYQRTLMNYGVALGRAGQSAKAVPVLEKNLALARELYGDDSGHTGTAHNELGSVLHDLGRFREAIAHYSEALRVGRKVAEASADYALPLNNLASAHEDMGDVTAAIPLFRQSLAIRRKTLPADDAKVLRAEYNLARALIKGGSLKEAKPLLDRALAGFLKLYGEANPATAKAQLWAGEWQLRSGNAMAAAESLTKLQASPAPFTPLLRAQRASFGAEIAAKRRDGTAALAARKDAWEILRQAWGELHPLTAQCAIEYAMALLDAGHRAEAEKVALPALPIVDAAFAADAPIRRMLAPWRLAARDHR